MSNDDNGKKPPEQRAEHLLEVAFDEILSYLEMAFRQADETGDAIAFTFRAEIDGRGEEAKYFCACQQKPEPAKSEKKTLDLTRRPLLDDIEEVEGEIVEEAGPAALPPPALPEGGLPDPETIILNGHYLDYYGNEPDKTGDKNSANKRIYVYEGRVYTVDDCLTEAPKIVEWWLDEASFSQGHEPFRVDASEDEAQEAVQVGAESEKDIFGEE
jgi:hypothetical protein